MTDITVSVGVDSKGAEQGAARVGRSLDDIRKKSKQVEDQAKRTGQEVSRLGSILGTALGAAGVRLVVRYADTYKNLESRLKTVTRSEAELNRVRKETLQIANQTRTSLDGVIALYTRAKRNTDQLGISQEKLLRLTELTSKAVQIGGASAAEAAAGVFQFSQALGKGKLDGDELKSIMEGMPVLAKAISDGLKVNYGDLGRLGEQGKLTAGKVIEALLSQGAALDTLFSKVNVTVGQAFTVLNNNVIDAIGRLDHATGASTALANAILFLADNIDHVGTVAGVVAVVFAARFAPSIVAVTVAMAASARAAITYAAAMVSMGGAAGVAATAMRGLSVSMAFLGGPLGVAIIAVSGAMYALSQSSDVAEKSQRDLNKTMGKFAGFSSDIIGASAKQRKEIIADATARLEAHKAELQGVTALAKAYLAMSENERLAEEIGTRIGNLFRDKDKETPLEAGKRFLALSEAVKEMGKSIEALKAIDANGGKPLTNFGNAGEEAAEKLDKLQEALDKLQGDARYDTLAVEMTEAERAILDLNVAIAKLTKEYGPLSEAQEKQVATIRWQTLEAVRAKEAYEKQQQAAKDALERSEELRREFLRPFENAADDMQTIFKDTFRDIFSGGVDSFGGLAKRVKGIFFELAAQIAALMVFRPQVLSAGGGIGGAIDAVFSGGKSTLDGGSADGGITDLFSLSNLSSIGKGLTTSVLSGDAGLKALEFLSGDLGLSLDTSANLINSFNPANIAGGFAGNFLGSKIFGDGGLPQTALSTIGGIAGSFIPVPFVGPAIGSFLGSAIGSLFGKKPSDKTAAGSVALGSGSLFDIGSLEGKKYSEENNAFRDFALNYAAGLANIIADETGKRLDQSLTVQIGNRDGLRYQFSGGAGGKAGDPNAFFRSITEAIAGMAEESGAASATLENLRIAIKNVDFKEPEKALQDLAFAANFDKLLDAPEKLTATEQALDAIKQQMDELRKTAERLGLSVEAVNQLEARRVAQLKQTALNAAAQGFLEQVSPGLAAITAEIQGFNEAIKELDAIGVDTTFVRLRHEQKLAELTRTLMEEENDRLRVLQDQGVEAARLVDTYTDLSKTLKEAAKALRIGNLSKLSGEERLKEARSQFNQTLQSALSGDTEAAGQLSGAGNALLELSRGYFAGGKGFSQDFDLVETGLLKVAAEATRQANLQEKAIQGTERQINAIQDNTRSVVAVIERLIRTNAEDLPAKLATLIAGAGGVSNLAGAVVSDARGTFLKTNANEMLVAALGSGSPVAMEILRQAGYTGAFGGGAAARAVEADTSLDARVKQIARARGIPGFARGGYPPLFQSSLVGEYGPEFITPLSPVRIDPMHGFKPMPANDNMGQVVFELRELVREMRAVGDDIAASNVGQGKLARDVQGTLIRLNGKLDKIAAQ